MTILFIGDIVGRTGRELLRKGVAALVARHQVDVVVANVENAAAGAGVTREIVDELFKYGVHVMTSGNHIWDKREVLSFIDRVPRLLRPANYPAGAPGAGSYVWTSPDGVSLGVINVMGRVFLANIDDPFATATAEIARVRDQGASVILVDLHAEATSEKMAFGWFVDGQVTAVVGTHTHVQTADERVLPGGTAYITDVGMTGPHDGVIGMDRASVIARFTTGIPVRFEAAKEDPRLHGVIISADAATGRARAIERVSLTAAELHALADAGVSAGAAPSAP